MIRTINKTLLLLAAILILCGQVIAQPSAKITGPKEAPAGEMVVLSSSGSKGKNLKWIKPDNLQTLQVGCEVLDTQVVFATNKAGVYSFTLIVVENDVIDYVSHSVTVGSPLPTKPDDPPPQQPPPQQPPPNPAKWSNLQAISKGNADKLNDAPTRSKLKAAIAAAILDCETKCAAGNCPTMQAAQSSVRLAIETVLLSRSGASAQVDWLSWRKSNQDELNKVGNADLKDYLSAAKAIGSGL